MWESLYPQAGLGVTLNDYFWFLLGDADAIATMAANVWSLPLGALLVLSAGLARNYDTRDLRRQWWRLLVPFAVSTLAAGLLLLAVMLMRGTTAIALGRGLLALFWLTAPLAWLYGIPYERLWPPADATRWRRGALGVVALYRVVLMTVCVKVLCGCTAWQAFVIVACFAIPTAMLALGAALILVTRPEAASQLFAAPAAHGSAAMRVVVEEMSGFPFVVDERGEHVKDVMVKQPDTPPPRPPQGTPDVTHTGQEHAGAAAAGCGVVVLLCSALALLVLMERRGVAWGPVSLPLDATPPSLGLWLFAAAAVVFWSAAALWRQPAQQRRTEFALRLRHRPLPDTMRALAEHDAARFPPGWDPSAVLARPSEAQRLLEACSLAAALPADSWVRRCFLTRLQRSLPLWTEWFDFERAGKDGQPAEPLREPARLQELTQLRDLLQALPERAEILAPYQEYLAQLSDSADQRDPGRAELIRQIYFLVAKRGCRR